jgi:hypothetical protein
MENPSPNPGESDDTLRCPRCGCDPRLSGGVIGRTCAICGGPLPAAGAARRQPSTAVLPNPHDEESAWQAWQHSVRVERWIWFVFAVGLLVAGVIGLVRGAG